MVGGGGGAVTRSCGSKGAGSKGGSTHGGAGGFGGDGGEGKGGDSKGGGASRTGERGSPERSPDKERRAGAPSEIRAAVAAATETMEADPTKGKVRDRQVLNYRRLVDSWRSLAAREEQVQVTIKSQKARSPWSGR